MRSRMQERMTERQMTTKQRAVLAALSTVRESSNAQVAEAAGVSEGYSSKVLRALAREKLAASREAEDAHDPQTHYRLWKRTGVRVPA